MGSSWSTVSLAAPGLSGYIKIDFEVKGTPTLWSTKQRSRCQDKMASEQFCLRWNDFESNISVAFRELREEKDFFDVTLACDDSQVQAHKVILSACSPFFRNILRRNPHQHPLLYLKGVKYKELLSVLDFMYEGEVNVAPPIRTTRPSSAPQVPRSQDPPLDLNGTQCLLPSVPDQPPLLRATTKTTTTFRRWSPSSSPSLSPPQPQQCAASGQQSQQQVKLEDEAYEDESYDCGEYGDGGYDDGSGTIDHNTGLSIQGAVGADGNKAVVEMKMWKETTADRGLIWRCADCDYTAKLKRGMFEHVESKHVGSQGYTCVYCGKHCPSKNALRSHVSRNHPKS